MRSSQASSMPRSPSSGLTSPTREMGRQGDGASSNSSTCETAAGFAAQLLAGELGWPRGAVAAVRGNRLVRVADCDETLSGSTVQTETSPTRSTARPTHSLLIPSKSNPVSPPICVSAATPFFRFFGKLASGSWAQRTSMSGGQRLERHADDVQPAGEPVERELTDRVAAGAERFEVGTVAVGWRQRGGSGRQEFPQRPSQLVGERSASAGGLAQVPDAVTNVA